MAANPLIRAFVRVVSSWRKLDDFLSNDLWVPESWDGERSGNGHCIASNKKSSIFILRMFQKKPPSVVTDTDGWLLRDGINWFNVFQPFTCHSESVVRTPSVVRLHKEGTDWISLSQRFAMSSKVISMNNIFSEILEKLGMTANCFPRFSGSSIN